MEIDVRKTLQDSAYIAVGVGVIGAQNVGTRAKAAQTKIQALVDDVCDRAALELPRPDTKALVGQARDAGTKAQAQAKQVTTRLTSQTRDIVGRAEPIVVDLRSRVEPLTEQLQALPEQITKALEASRQRVRPRVASAS
jgi:polyhydroxyalkanoate synthesis regulator phasin